MNPRLRAAIQMSALLAVLLILFLVFPPVFAFVEMAARELRYLWWLILLAALSVWLIWGLGRRPKK